MYPNLRAELARRNLGLQEIADLLGLTTSSASKKIAGKQTMTLSEAFKIQKWLNTDITLDELFKREE